jgi:very-short-patch-repair endonuclease
MFEQSPSSHLTRKTGCPICSNNKRLTTQQFIEKAEVLHEKKYDYSLVEYYKTHENVQIICPEHGEFEQLPSNHLRYNRGCPKCKAIFSNIEKDFLRFVEENYLGEVQVNVKNIIKPYELDIYLPELKLAFEFNGLYWHSEKFVYKNYHLDKTLKCEEKGIHLIHIYEDDWVYKQDIVKSRILNLLGKSKKIFGRKCIIKEVCYKDSKEFLETNHIQGNCLSKIRLGLYYEKELISLMTFSNLRKNLGQIRKEGSFELLRFCNKLNITVVGGANKLFKYFINTYEFDSIISYADRSWTMNNGKSLYDKLGFKFITLTNPNYFYVNKGIRENRFKYRKNILLKQGFDKNKTEHQIMLKRNLYRIFDSGSMKYEFKNQNEIY